jgi:alpha-beta hydrolase superfamily lysophospholipase
MRDGMRLVVHRWPTPASPPAPRGTVLVVHGLGEHAGRHGRVAARLRAWGWAPVSYDHRGHGRSAGRRGAIRHADDLITDLATVVDTVRPADGTPFLLLGHSMGGGVAARFVADAVRPVDGLVLSSAALAGRLSRWQRAQLALALALAPDLPVPNGFDPATISHDPAVVQAYREDPLVHDRVSGRLVKSLLEGGAHALARAHAWSVPTLVLWAHDDHLVSPEGSAEFVRRAPREVVTAQGFPGLYHEIFNELEPAPVSAAPRRGPDLRFPRAG